jgi:hypothetical protein
MGKIYITSFVKICTGVQSIIRFYLINLKGGSVGIIDEGDFFAVGMDSGAMIYIPNFIKNDSGIQMLMAGYAQRARCFHRPILIIFK